MRLLTLSICLYLFSLQAGAQEITGEEKKAVAALMDSAKHYELISPQRTLEIANTILAKVPLKGNEKLYVTTLLLATNSLKMVSKKEESLNLIHQALTISEAIGDIDLQIRSNFMKATIFGQDDDQDSSLVYYQKVINLHYPGHDPYFVSSSYMNIGQVYNAIGSLQKAEEYLLKGYQLSSSDEYAKIFTLSTLINFYATNHNPKYLTYLDTLAMSDFYKKASTASFMAHFDTFLSLDEASDPEKEKTLREVYSHALKNGSLSNQVGYGMRLFEQLLLMHKHEEARLLLLELYQIAKEAKNATHVAAITKQLYEINKTMGNLPEALTYLERHSQLRDSLLSDENATRISELNIKFEAAQKDNEINQQRQQLEQARRNRIFLILLTILLFILGLVTFIYFRNRARTARRIAAQDKLIHQQESDRLRKEKEVAELIATLDSQEKERHRIARDLHDGLGSMMSGISSQIEYLRSLPAESITQHPQLNQLKELVKEASAELRRTSYELMPAKLLRQGLEPAIRDLCFNLLVKNGIEPTMEVNTELTSLTSEEQLTLYRIIQELLNNIVKHAEARNVLIQFTRFENEISLVIEDDGKGFDVDVKRQDGGLGLGSLGSRVSLLNGFLDIGSKINEGTTVTINFMLSSSSSPSEG